MDSRLDFITFSSNQFLVLVLTIIMLDKSYATCGDDYRNNRTEHTIDYRCGLRTFPNLRESNAKPNFWLPPKSVTSSITFNHGNFKKTLTQTADNKMLSHIFHSDRKEPAKKFYTRNGYHRSSRVISFFKCEMKTPIYVQELLKYSLSAHQPNVDMGRFILAISGSHERPNP